MLTLLANTIQQVVFALQSLWSAASCIGRLICTATTAVLFWTARAVDSVATFWRILYEDNEPLLSQELPAAAAAVDERLTAAREIFESSVRAAGAVLAGAGTKALEAAWWVVTFAPRQGPMLLQLTWSLAPELAGVALLWSIWRAGQLARAQGMLRALWWRLRMLGDADLQWLWRTEPEDQPEGTRLLSEETGVSPACVVCRERVKSVLTLPCRHVCLCRECCDTIFNYQRRCPICRTFIYHTVNIYM